MHLCHIMQRLRQRFSPTTNLDRVLGKSRVLETLTLPGFI
jgi:hypothetical protein